MVRSLAPAVVLFAVLTPHLAHAQVNIDQDKTPAHIYANDCAVCHKSIRGLANGRGSSALAAFLTEHYTSNEQEAAALAAYVLAGGGGSGTPASARDAFAPDRDHAASGEPKTREARRSPKPLPEPSAGPKPTPRSRDRSRLDRGARSASVEPSRDQSKLVPDRREPVSADRAHERPRPADATPAKPEPAKLAAGPKVVKPLKPDAVAPVQSPSVPSPQVSQPSGPAPAPTDNIPD